MIARFFTIAAAGLMAAASLCAQQTGYLKTKVDPGRAGVFVDGKYVGPAANFRMARKYALAPGEHKIKLVEPRYEDIDTTVTIQAGKTAELKQTMKALPVPKGPFGRLRTENADKFAAVYVNEHYMGHVDEFSNPFQGLELPAGDYSVQIAPTSGQPINQKVKIEAGKTVLVK
ncbi:MAG: PEGA domain-containing protein [Acidobacteriota bacterium]|nr:PEGA domain-containing protein [Acidobacteriota bacterium]